MEGVFSNQNRLLDKKNIIKYLTFWPYIILSIIISLLLAFIYLRYSDYNYRTSSRIEIIDMANDSDMALPSAMTIFNRSTINLENEIGVLSSFNLHKKVVKNLKSNIKFFTIGRVKETESHKSEFFQDYELTFDINAEQIKSSTEFFIDLDNDGMKISYLYKDIKKSYLFKEFDTKNVDHDLPFQLKLNKSFLNKDLSNEPSRKILFVDFLNTVKFFSSKTKIIQSGINSDQLDIYMEYPNTKIAEDYINMLISMFDMDGIIDRQLEHERTIDFVDTRSVLLSKELDKIETRKKIYKEENNLSDLKSDADITINQQFSYDAELFKAESQYDLINLLESELSEKNYNLIPVNIGLNNQVLNQVIENYNNVVRERERFLSSGLGINNSFIKNLNSQLDNFYLNIKRSIVEYKESLESNILKLTIKKNDFQSTYNSIPEVEKVLRSINRELEIKESLFLLLLQKREEAAINKAVVKPSIKIIDNALSSAYPVSPNKILIYALSIVLGISLPILFLAIWFYFDSRIHTREQLLDRIKETPVVGEIPVLLDDNELKTLSVANSRSILAESIRMIMVNLNFILFNDTNQEKNNLILVTSSIKGEGKTIISTNIASILTSKFKKVLLIGADLRNPQIHKFIGKDKNTFGLSDYILNEDISWKDLIIKEKKLDILLSGTIPPNPTELLGSKKFQLFLEDVKHQYDYIIIDSAPCLLVSDTFEISKFIDTTLYVVRSNFSEIKLCDFINETINLNKIKNVNLVLNAVGSSKSYGYRYGYQYGYKYGYRYGYNYGYGYGYEADNEE